MAAGGRVHRDVACSDGVKFSMASDSIYVCTTAGGVIRGAVAADTSHDLAPCDAGASSLGGTLDRHPHAGRRRP